ncbi:hypothetical protein, partial [Xenorhabdus doucetiae]|uniref:hypothetical protein n=1 Tax=Xenorhabdus doucetiae TaxID=351671 RepID=UPI002B40FFB4
NRAFVPGCEAAYLTLFASGVKRLFSLSSCFPRGCSQLGVGQWWRIIGSFTALAIVFLYFIFRWAFFILFDIKTIQID